MTAVTVKATASLTDNIPGSVAVKVMVSDTVVVEGTVVVVVVGAWVVVVVVEVVVVVVVVEVVVVEDIV